MHERQGEVEPPAIGGLGEPHSREQGVCAVGALPAREALERGLEDQVLAARKQRVEGGLLERRADDGRGPGRLHGRRRSRP